MAKERKYVYKIITVLNGVPHREHGSYKTLKGAQKKYSKVLPQNQVIFEKKYSNVHDIAKFSKELLLLAKKPADYQQQYILSSDGKLHKEEIIGDWIILSRTPLHVEEEFYIYGLKKRLTFIKIIRQVFNKRTSDIYQVLMFFNKIVLISGSDMEVILCKNLDDCLRFYNMLFEKMMLIKNPFFVFLGNTTKKNRKLYFDRLQEFTGLKRQELYRTSTRS